MQNGQTNINFTDPVVRGTPTVMRSWIIGSNKVELYKNGSMDITCGYTGRHTYNYYLQGARIDGSKSKSFILFHRLTLDVVQDDGQENEITLPMLVGFGVRKRFTDAISSAATAVSIRNMNRDKPKFAQTGMILLLALVLIIIGLLGWSAASDYVKDLGSQEKQTQTQDDQGSNVLEALGQSLGQGFHEFKEADKLTIWRKLFPHTEGTSELALAAVFLLLIALAVSVFLPGKIMKMVTTACMLLSIAGAIYTGYQLDFKSPDLWMNMFFAVLPLLLAFLTALVFYFIARKLAKAGKDQKYSLMTRIGYLLSYVMTLMAVWFGLYGYMHISQGWNLPYYYPEKVLELGDTAYLYLSMGTILAMLILGACLKAPHFAGTMGMLFSLGMLGITGYDLATNSQPDWIPAACAAVLLIVSLAVRSKKDQAD